MIALHNWMAQSSLGDSLVRDICFPATHDSGTYGLTDELTFLGAKVVEDIIKDTFQKLEDAGVPPTILQQAAQDAWAAARDTAFGLATTTHCTVGEQLDQGIRALDLRVAYDPSETSQSFYIHHILFGPPIADILTDIANFVKSVSGEIVYVTMTGWRNFDVEHPESAQPIFDQLAQQIVAAMPEGAILTPGDCDPSLFEMQYSAVTSNGTKSRVIFAMGEGSTFSDTYSGNFFDSLYCPPNEKRAKTVIAGRYTDTTTVQTVLTEQGQMLTENFTGAKLPFALYMTLTPSGTDYVLIIGAAVVDAVLFYTSKLPGIPVQVLDALAKGFAVVTETAYKTVKGWWTLQQLSAQLDTALDAHVTDLIYDAVEANGGMPKPAKDDPPRTPITFLYVDFFENTNVVNLAMDLTGGHVYTWQGNQPLSFKESYTFQGAPAAAAIDEQLFIGFIGSGSHPVQLSKLLPDSTNSWSGPTALKSAGSDGAVQTSPLGVAMAAWTTTPIPPQKDQVGEPAVYAVYPVVSGKTSSMSMVVLTKAEAAEITSCNPIPISISTKVTPSLAVFNDQLVMAYTNSSNVICIATYEQSTGEWTDHGKLTGPSSAQTASTSKPPAICTYGDQLVLVYQGSSNNLYWAWTNDPAGTWNVNAKIDVQKSKSSRRLASNTGTPQSLAGPGLCVFRGLLYLVYRGTTYHNLLLATYNGNAWVGNDTIDSIASHKAAGTSSFNPESNANPALAVAGNTLALIYAAESGGKVWGSMLTEAKVPIVFVG